MQLVLLSTERTQQILESMGIVMHSEPENAEDEQQGPLMLGFAIDKCSKSPVLISASETPKNYIKRKINPVIGVFSAYMLGCSIASRPQSQ